MSRKKSYWEFRDSYVPAAMLGCAIGDAMGMPFEMRGRAIHPDLAKWDGKSYMPGTHHKLEAGTWTDDTEMTICLAKSLIDSDDFVGERVAQQYLEWYEGTPTGMGGTTRVALEKFKKLNKAESKDAWRHSGVYNFNSPDEVGAGTVMRVAPIGVFFSKQPDVIRKVCREDAFITHRHIEAFSASLAVASLIAGIIRNQHDFGNQPTVHRKRAIEFMFNQLIVVDESITVRVLKSVLFDGTGFSWQPDTAVDDLAGRYGNAWQIAVTAIHCAMHMWGQFDKCIEAAIRMGGDTDTRGAVAGAIQGTVVGTAGLLNLHEGLVSGVKHHETLSTLDDVLWANRPLL